MKSTAEIRKEFLDFFRSKGHQVLSSSSLVPDDDPTLLFTNAGMNQFKHLFLNTDSYFDFYRRVTTSQRCVRAGGKHNDLENVGYTTRHHTFFEMLGNFSFGDYFKYDAIQFAWELLTSKKLFNIPKDKLLITVYAKDNESYDIWSDKIGISSKRILRIGDNKGIDFASDNFWQMGDTGPCGPCSEIFYDHGEHIQDNCQGTLKESSDRYIEIWNIVFMQFNRQSDGTLLSLSKPSIDTGMGLERIAAVLQHVHSNYDIDIFKKLISVIAQVTKTQDLNNKSLRVIADHIRSCVFLISDGVLPSNDGRGYVIRRIIRRAIRHGNMLGTNDNFFYKLVAPLIDIMDDISDKLKSQQTLIERILLTEEEQFSRTLERGIKLLDKELNKLNGNTLDGEIAFRLYDTYGFPFDLTYDICRERNLNVDEPGFNRAMLAQQKRSHDINIFTINYNNLFNKINTRFVGYEKLTHQGKIVAIFRDNKPVEVIYQGEESIIVLDETTFYSESGGQVGDQGKLKASSGIFDVSDTKKYNGSFIGHFGKVSCGKLKLGSKVIAQVDSSRREKVCLNHSATHLLHATLRQVLGKHIQQRGSLVNDEYLRFDFSHNEAIKIEQIHLIENIINLQIRRNLPIQTEILSLKDANNKGAISLYGKKYDTKVRVISISDFSIELCKGTHTKYTGNIGLFYINSEFGIASGTRRIEAFTGEMAMSSVHYNVNLVHKITQLFKCNSSVLIDKIISIQQRLYQLEKNLQKLKNKQAIQDCKLLIKNNVNNINGVTILIGQLNDVESKMLITMIKDLKNRLSNPAIIILATITAGKVNLIAKVTRDLINQIKATDIINYIIKQIKGKGGGNSDLAQASSSNIAVLPSVLSNLNNLLAKKFSLK